MGEMGNDGEFGGGGDDNIWIIGLSNGKIKE